MHGRSRTAARAAALAVLAAAPAAQAQTTPAETIVTLFRGLCLATGGDRVAALAAADKGGWFPVPDAAMAASAPRFQNPAGRLHTESGGFQFLIVGGQTRTLGGREVALRACAVGGSVTQRGQLDTGAQQLAGVPASPRLSAAGESVWVFTDADGRHAPLDDGDARRTAAALESGVLRVIARQTRVTPGMPTGLSLLVLDTPGR